MDKKIRDRKDTFVNKILLFRLKLANIAPKHIKYKVQAKNLNLRLLTCDYQADYNRY